MIKVCFNCKKRMDADQFKDPHLCMKCSEDHHIDYKLHLYKCKHCGAEFSSVKTPKNAPKFCSKHCYADYMRTEGNPKKRAAKLPVASMDEDLEERYCVVCGKIIPPTRSNNAKTCSDKCSVTYKSDYKYRVAYVQEAQNRKNATSPEARSKAMLTSFKDIIKTCSKLGISYGYYQQLKYTDKLDDYLKEHSDLLN